MTSPPPPRAELAVRDHAARRPLTERGREPAEASP